MYGGTQLDNRSGVIPSCPGRGLITSCPSQYVRRSRMQKRVKSEVLRNRGINIIKRNSGKANLSFDDGFDNRLKFWISFDNEDHSR